MRIFVTRNFQVMMSLVIGVVTQVPGTVMTTVFDFSEVTAWERLLLIVFSCVIVFLVQKLLFQTTKHHEVQIDVHDLEQSDERLRHQARGMIAFVSLYKPLPKSKASQLDPAQVRAAITACDYETLDLANFDGTTFGHLLREVTTHSENGHLKHLWLVTTKGVTASDNDTRNSIPVLTRFIKEKINPDIEIHAGDSLCIELKNDADICRRAYDLVKDIYSEALKGDGFTFYNETRKTVEKLRPKQIVTDVTAGITALRTGAILACLDKDYCIQYVGGKYNEAGNIVGASGPYVVHYEVK